MIPERYIKKFNEKNFITTPVDLGGVVLYFQKLSKAIQAKEPEALIIGDYLHQSIAAANVRKRKVSAREFEDFIAMALGGKVMDEETRKNYLPEGEEQVGLVLKYSFSNKREKMDVLFGTAGYGISVKTSMPDNSEINMGSFAREALFYDFLEQDEYGGERKQGLGSKPQIKKVFSKIESLGRWKKFCSRVSQMLDIIFTDDILYVIKADDKLEIYFVESAKFREMIKERFEVGPSETIRIINRYEGNSIRIDRTELMNRALHISLDFSEISNTRLYKAMQELSNVNQLLLDSFCDQESGNAQNVVASKMVEEIWKKYLIN